MPDPTPPIITPTVAGTLGNNGWYVSDIAISWSVVDSDSTVTSTSGCEAQIITTDTAGATYTCTATSAGGTATESITVKRDANAPGLTPTVALNPLLLNSTATAEPGASDILSGVAGASCGTVDATSVGIKALSCTATDNAGNSATATVQYTVFYGFTGFSAPVDNPPVLNVAKAGQSIPLKWRLVDANGTPVPDLAGVTVTAVSMSCSLGTTPDQIEEYAAGGSGFQNLGNGYYQFNWKTPGGYANSCKTLKLDLGEGTGRDTAFFQLR
jgi:hypothetical protein